MFAYCSRIGKSFAMAVEAMLGLPRSEAQANSPHKQPIRHNAALSDVPKTANVPLEISDGAYIRLIFLAEAYWNRCWNAGLPTNPLFRAPVPRIVNRAAGGPL